MHRINRMHRMHRIHRMHRMRRMRRMHSALYLLVPSFSSFTHSSVDIEFPFLRSLALRLLYFEIADGCFQFSDL